MTAIKRAKQRFSRHFYAKAMYRMVWGSWIEQPKRLFVAASLLGTACFSRMLPGETQFDAECVWKM